MKHGILFASYFLRGDALMTCRWRWLRRYLPPTRNGETLLDVGCGSGAFTLGAARRGYRCTGLSWDRHEMENARRRARQCNLENGRGPGSVEFRLLDARKLDQIGEFRGGFDVVLCCECAEHILDDLRLFRALTGCLRPGGRLLFTAPNAYYLPLTRFDMGPFSAREDGGHVRRGYSPAMLNELCAKSGLVPENISYAGGLPSQKLTGWQRRLSGIHPIVGWALLLPFRPLAFFDDFLFPPSDVSGYSICLVALKPRFARPN